jgi:nucleoside-diphosphate-sugar epimerase
VSAVHQRFTILGASGFIGAALVAWLESHDHTVHAVTRAVLPSLLGTRRPVGHVIDCIGLTANFRTRPLDTAEAHVGLVARCLAELHCDSFLLLSSTRVYARAAATLEDTPLPTLPTDASDLYNATKLAGEALCLADARSAVRVVRLSNVYGLGMPEQTFLGQVLCEGRRTGRVTFGQSPGSAKDYVSIAAVARLLPRIAVDGKYRLYNLATGENVSHGAIADTLRTIAGWQTGFEPEAPTVAYRPIDTTRLDAEFGPAGSRLIADFPTLLALQQECACSPSMRLMAA